MHVLVIGRNGQLAHALRQCTPARLTLTAAGRPQVDLRDADSLRRMVLNMAPDVVINAAAYTAVDRAESEPGMAFAINAEGAGLLAAVTAEVGALLIHVSTDYVFDGTKPAPYVETDATGPLNVYGASKLAGEQRVRAANPRHVIVRTSWVVSGHGANFCRTVLRLARERDALRVVADQQGAPTFAPDLARALLATAEQLGSAPAGDPRFGTYHLANAGETTWADLAEATLAASGRHGGRSVPVERITTADYPTPARRPMNSRLDCSRASTMLRIEMPPWRDAIERCVEDLMRASA